jgi:hypothetical protein
VFVFHVIVHDFDVIDVFDVPLPATPVVAPALVVARLCGGVFPRRDQDCLWIERRDDQSLGFGCAGALNNRPSSAKTDACWLALQTNWSS